MAGTAATTLVQILNGWAKMGDHLFYNILTLGIQKTRKKVVIVAKFWGITVISQ